MANKVKDIDDRSSLFSNSKSAFSMKSGCVYTSCYCEENVWKLCQSLENQMLQESYVVFVSNDGRHVPLWCHIASNKRDGLVVWDYHVFLVHSRAEGSLVYDFDSRLAFPNRFEHYVEHTFRPDTSLPRELHRYFRVVPGLMYLRHFSSDRRHMKKHDGSWSRPPPNYPPISTEDCTHNLDDYISMDPGEGVGEVMPLEQFIERFTLSIGSSGH